MKSLRVYSTKTCPRCSILKATLARWERHYEEASLEDAKTLTDLRLAGCFEIEAPILQVDGIYYPARSLFLGPNVDEEFLREII